MAADTPHAAGAERIDAIREHLRMMPIPSHLTEREYRRSTREWLDREAFLLGQIDRLCADLADARAEAARLRVALSRLVAVLDAENELDDQRFGHLWPSLSAARAALRGDSAGGG